MKFAAVAQKIESFIAASVKRANAGGVVLGMSGGVDSALVATLCVRALGPKKVFALLMPEEGQEAGAAEEYAKKLGIKYETINISALAAAYERNCSHTTREKIVLGNLRPRIRMTLLYYHANLMNCIVAGTGNKSELLVGYFTKYGDGGVDILPVGGLYKTHVRALARELGVPKKIVDAVPSAGLWPGQTDEGELGVKYAELDKLLYALHELKQTPEQAAKFAGVGRAVVGKIISRMKSGRHKLEMPPVCNVGPLPV